MGGILKPLAVVMICGSCAARAFCQTPPSSPAASSPQLLEMRMSPDPTVRAVAAKRALSDQIAADLASPDPNVQVAATNVLKRLISQDLRDPAGVLIIKDKPEWCGRCLGTTAFLVPLVKLGEEDLFKNIAAVAISDGSNVTAGDQAEAGLVKLCLMTRKYDDALPAAKTYYNCCALEHTAAALICWPRRC
jgi:hypothetical protein